MTPMQEVRGEGAEGWSLAEVLDRLNGWFARFICTTTPDDIDLLTLWTAHTHVCLQTRTTPRLILDSLMPGSGKTTVLDHLNRLAFRPVLAASLSSPALLVRLLKDEPRTILIDEVDRTLNPKEEGTKELLAVLNSGYRVGGNRPVLTPVKGGDWEPVEMPTYGPVVMAGNMPSLPDDTRSRSIRVLLMRDDDGAAEDSDWEEIEPEAQALARDLAAALEQCRDQVAASRPVLPTQCTGRMKEVWRPLARVADVAGGRWPDTVLHLYERHAEEVAAEIAEGVANRSPAVVLISDLAEVWDPSEPFLPTADIVARLKAHNPGYWSAASAYGADVNGKRISNLLNQGAKIRSQKDSRDRRGYRREDFLRVWRQVGAHPSGEPSNPSHLSDPSETSDQTPTVATGQTLTTGAETPPKEVAAPGCPHGAPDPSLCLECQPHAGADDMGTPDMLGLLEDGEAA